MCVSLVCFFESPQVGYDANDAQYRHDCGEYEEIFDGEPMNKIESCEVGSKNEPAANRNHAYLVGQTSSDALRVLFALEGEPDQEQDIAGNRNKKHNRSVEYEVAIHSPTHCEIDEKRNAIRDE